jgi:iron complex transport system substrate-binding protein
MPHRRTSAHPLGIALGGLVALVALTACSTGPSGDSATDPGAAAADTAAAEPGAFPVTVEHAYGATTIEQQPMRVATLGWSDQDVALALGVAPVGAVQITWGGNDQQSTPWYDERLAELGGSQPTRYNDADGAPIDEVAALQPDLILATNSGVTEQEYRKLTKIAPVVAFPGDPWVTTWQESLEMVGQALGRSALAAELEADTEASIATAAETHPQVVGKTFIFAALATTDMSKIDYYTPADNRPRLLADLGMVNAPVIEEISEPGAFYGTLSAERAADLESDVFITYAETDDDLAAFRENKLLGRIPGIANGHVLASTDKTDALGLSAPSPLAIPYAMEHFVPLVAQAVDGA